MPDDGVFGGLRAALLAERERIAERLEAVDQAEAAIDRVRDVFGISDAPRSAVEAPGREGAVSGSTPPPPTPPDSASPAGEPTSPKKSACRECGGRFEPRRGGQPHRYCSDRCRKLAHTRRRQPSKRNGRARSIKRGAARSADTEAPGKAAVISDLALAWQARENVAADLALRWEGRVLAKNGPAVRDARAGRLAAESDRAADDAFVRAALPLLGAEARERAELVRLRPGDPVRALLEA